MDKFKIFMKRENRNQETGNRLYKTRCTRLVYCNIKITPTTTGDHFNSECVVRNSELKGLRRDFNIIKQLHSLI